MDYFLLSPRMVGSRTSRVYEVHGSGLQPRRDFIGYSSERLKEKVVRACGDYRSRSRKVESYGKALEELEPFDVVVVTTMDTMSSKPPKKRAELPGLHPANELVQQRLNRRLYQLEMRGKTGCVAVIEPLFMPAVITPGMPFPEMPESLREYYVPNRFYYLDDVELQEKKHKRNMERLRLYGEDHEKKEFDRERERMLIKGWEAKALELVAGFVEKKCGETCVLEVPHSSPTKKFLAEGLADLIPERRPELNVKDVIGKHIFTEKYNMHNTCASSVLGSLTTYLGNIYGFRYQRWEKPEKEDEKVRSGRLAEVCPYGPIMCESAPKVGDQCRDQNDERNCINKKFARILSKYDSPGEITGYIRERGIVIPGFLTVKKGIEFDLRGGLEPFELPVERNLAYDVRCSSVASSRDPFHYHMRELGLLDEFPEITSEVGKFCHEVIYESAPAEYRLGMERPGILIHEPESGPLEGEEIRIHATPDCALRSGSWRQVIPLDWKTGEAPLASHSPRFNHALQAAAYSLYIMQVIDDRGEKLGSDYACVTYMRDRQFRRPVNSRARTEKLRERFLKKVEETVFMERRWADDPSSFLSDLEKASCRSCQNSGKCMDGFRLYEEKML